MATLLDAAAHPPPPPPPSSSTDTPKSSTPSGTFASGGYPPRFPTHSSPRVWFLTAGNSPTAIMLATRLLPHGDHVVCGVNPADWEGRRLALSAAGVRMAPGARGLTDSSAPSPAPSTPDEPAVPADRFRAFLAEVKAHPEWPGTLRIVEFDVAVASSVQAAVADALAVFGRVDILLLCNAGTLLGTVEELGHSPHAVQEQFGSTFFGPVNVIRALLPAMRQRRAGHVMLLTGITGHLGTPGLGAFCASQWAIEGYCDSLAYEVAPFNIRVSILQSNMEIGVLTNRVSAVPEMDAYKREAGNDAPLARGLIGGLLKRLENAAGGTRPGTDSAILRGNQDGSVQSVWPVLPISFVKELLGETVYAVLAIGGHENPPARHIVGQDGVTSVKEKLRTVSEELEEFIEVSSSVDFAPSSIKSRQH